MPPTRNTDKGRRKRPRFTGHGPIQVNLAAILSIGHACRGCTRPETCCCARYEVCVNTAELNRIIQVLPEVGKLCPHLRTAKGYDNVFDEVEPGLYALDTTDKGLCVFAFMSGHTIRCSLHSAALNLGLPLGKVKPQACLLWPLSASANNEFLSLDSEALSFRCISRRRNPSRKLSPSLLETIKLLYGETFSAQLEKEAKKGLQHTKLYRKALLNYPSEPACHGLN
ncbi:MAG: hypothetical protein Q7J98_03910 [Kiritimatiellia bacterium]|nr:hypothetical protein [Kiritimatiellia bacterium]